MRTSLVATVVAMGLLGLSMAIISGRIYRTHSVDSARTALVEQVRSQLEDVRRRFDREAEVLRNAYPKLQPSTSKIASIDQLWAQLYANTPSAYAPVAVLRYDIDQRLVGAHPPRVNAAAEWRAACEHLWARILTSSGSPSASSTSGYCFADGSLHYAVLLPAVEPKSGHVLIVFDIVDAIADIEKRAGLRLRLLFEGGWAIYQSPLWPTAQIADRYLLAAHVLSLDVPDSPPLLLQIAKDESQLYAQLDRTQYAVLFAASAMTLLLILAALAFLERTAVAPLSGLTEQLRRVRQDETQAGERVAVGGNAEISELAKGFNEMTAKIEGLYKNLERMAFTDSLTQLPNRNLFQRQLADILLQAQHDSKAFALFIMDLDRFKEINDTLGHHIGDLLLQQVAARLNSKLREGDVLARLGGDEFAVLLPNVTIKQADMAARMLLQVLRNPFDVEGNDLHVRASIGVALYPDHGVDVNTLIQRADVSMYSAKAAGCGHAFYDPEMDRHHPARLTLMGELRQAVEQEQFVLYYQPKIGLDSDRVVGFEALVRWRHPSGRLILPETFISLLEQTGLIRSLTLWAINEALRTGAELRSQGLNLPIAVNISARDLQDSNLIQELAEQLASHHASADWLELELTESAVMADVGGTLEMLTRLAAMGFRLVLDDFGTGHSSLAYLKRLPLNIVKVDKSFVMGMARDENDAAIVSTSIALAHNLGLQVVAEGVDSAGALEQLRRRGCDAVQGIYLSRPLAREEMAEWLAKSTWGVRHELVS